MIVVFCALFCEAEALIAHFQLHKDNANTHFQVFGDAERELRVAVTGTGPVAAAAAVGSICTRYGVGKNDMLLNIGTCAASDEPAGGIYLCHKLVEAATGRTFYPDMLYRHPFAEATVITRDTVWQGEAGGTAERTVLYDMEAAAVYQAGSRFVGPHRMQFIKLVSDHGAGASARSLPCKGEGRAQSEDGMSPPENISSRRILALMRQQEDRLSAYVERLERILREEDAGRAELSPPGQSWLARLGEDLHCSQAMRGQLRRLLWYQELSGGNYEAVISEMYGEGKLPCKDKREGKTCFEELKRRFL